MSKFSILLDVSFGIQNYSGIPQDTRLMFKTLSSMENVDLTGLVYEMKTSYTRRLKVKQRRGSKKHFDNLDISVYLMSLSGAGGKVRGEALFRRIQVGVQDVLRLFRSEYPLCPVLPQFHKDVVWRLFFMKTLTSEDRPAILSGKFCITNMTLGVMFDYLLARRWLILHPRKPRINTSQYDFVIFQDSRPVDVSSNSIALYRYHDPIQITHSDTFSNPREVKYHFKAVNDCALRGYYVCNSEITHKSLVNLFPRLEERSFTVPYALPSITKSSSALIPVAEIVKARLTTVALSANAGNAVKEKVIAQAQLVD